MLENRLNEKYIIGKKQIQFTLNDVKFHLAQQHDMRQIMAEISRKYKETSDTKYDYFEEAAIQLIRNVKMKIEQRADTSGAEEKTMDENDNSNSNKHKLTAFKTATYALEQVLLTLSRQMIVPSRDMEMGHYMEDLLHLQPIEFAPFKGLHLLLKHSYHLWQHVERWYMLFESTWQKTPAKVNALYQNPVTETLKHKLSQFVEDTPIVQMWMLLKEWRLLLETKLCQQNYEYMSIIMFKQHLIIFVQNQGLSNFLVKLPDELSLQCAATAYELCVGFYEKKGFETK
ncbi:hypothetical protein RFI_24841 [Reticulomyxa filosa]|uniref:Uncharacterized protein n=1 Tax=Reticulomyxa filosa TaxID=46433 RepID=X6MET0_RETFI|nr:hypothetical protein RFI_24841 [Reticulomyxa filosa]|eukprot:ETO12533.1 hypothetical protein RFI_24841 [Reticulomyxa filosa]